MASSDPSQRQSLEVLSTAEQGLQLLSVCSGLGFLGMAIQRYCTHFSIEIFVFIFIEPQWGSPRRRRASGFVNALDTSVPLFPPLVSILFLPLSFLSTPS